MEDKVERYDQLKRLQKELEQELSALRQHIMDYCEENGAIELEVGDYRVKLVRQQRKEYDDRKLYEALPDPEVWRMISKPDGSKVAAMIKLNVISEESIKDTFSIKNVTLLQVDKR